MENNSPLVFSRDILSISVVEHVRKKLRGKSVSLKRISVDNSFPRKLKIISRDFSTPILFLFWPFVINDATKMDTEIKFLSFTTKIL